MELDTLQNMTNEIKLLTAFKQRNSDEFKEIIKCEDLSDFCISHIRVKSDDGISMTLLDWACESSETSEYVLILLLNGASETHWRGVKLTEAFEKNLDITTINYLVVTNILKVEPEEEDGFYDNLIRTSVEKNDLNIMRLLAYYRSKNFAPESTHLLPLLGSIETVRLLIEYFDVDMEFQRDSHGHARTYRDIILQKFPQLEPELPSTRSQSELRRILLSYLRNNAPELFLNRFAELSTEFLDKKFFDVGDTDSSSIRYPILYSEYSYLYVACKKGYVDVVDALLKKDVQLNTLDEDWYLGSDYALKITPLAVAAYMGHYEIVTKLISHNAHLQIEGSGSVLNFVIHGMNRPGFSKDTHRRILKLLLDRRTCPALDINQKDWRNCTPLHYAITLKNEFAFKSLLHAGADLYTKDTKGKLLLTSVPATILEEYLDDCIKLHTEGLEQVVTFDHGIFRQVDQNFNTTGNEIEFFHQVYQQNPQLKTLLMHPLSESFLYVKWCLIRRYYSLNFAFYLSFCVALNAYIFQIHDCPSSSTSYDSSKLTDNGINYHASSILCDAPWLGLGIITFLMYSVFILQELCQIFLLIGPYFRSPGKWMEMMMIVAVGVFFTNQRNAHLGAAVNVMSCIKLVLLLGKHPLVSIYIEMFKTVALNFAKFLALFSILAISFANSFYVLFRDRTEDTSSENETNVDPSNQTIENSINSWPDWWVSFIKSIIMMTGEFDASNLPLCENFNCNYVFLLLFIFLVTMALYNLLNGLAISDTNAIMEDSEIAAVMSRVEQIWQLERVLNSKSLQFYRKHCPFVLRYNVFRNIYAREIIVYSSSKYNIKLFGFRSPIGKMPLTIIKQVEQIIEKRNRSNSSKNMDQNFSADAAKKTSSNSASLDEAGHNIGDEIRNLKLEIDEMKTKITDRDEKLLQNVERNNKLLESAVNGKYLKQKK